MIEIYDLSFRYRPDHPYLFQSWNWSLPAGSRLWLRGPSGSGKSTLLSLLLGIIKPRSGKLIIGGKDIFQLSDAERSLWRARNTGVVFQRFNLLEDWSVKDNIRFIYELYNSMLPEWDERRYQYYLDFLGLKAHEQKQARQLSVGQQQRVAFIRALMHKPSWIFADEPISSLDEESAKRLSHLLKEYLTETRATLILSSHIPLPGLEFDLELKLPLQETSSP
jgi:putative ABC transport system ATP-binding protein